MVMNTRALDRAEAVSETRVRTLVVDDSPFMLKILAQILEAAGNFDLVGTATDGCKALRYVSMLSPDLVLMDIHMPGLNGVQVTRSIKQSEHSPVVILASSDDSSVTKTTAEEAGADAFVSKEGNLRNQLMGALQDLFGPGSEKPEAVGISFQNKLAGYSKQEHGT
jgi:Response regulator containing a CheY-like receiver domain and an HTH DNA-binding domain